MPEAKSPDPSPINFHAATPILRVAKEGEPFGEWLDMRGVRWTPAPGGGWARSQPT